MIFTCGEICSVVFEILEHLPYLHILVSFRKVKFLHINLYAELFKAIVK